jgi:hypothetical protein
MTMLTKDQVSKIHCAEGKITETDRIFYIGTRDTWGGASMGIYVHAQYKDGKFSLSGVEGPRRSGNCTGGAGQISMGYLHRDPEHNDKRYDTPILPEQIRFAAGWNKELWWDLLEIWHDWHLNDMSPSCEHQQALGWGKKELEVCTWQLKKSVQDLQKGAENRAMVALRSGEPYQAQPSESFIVKLPCEVKAPRESAAISEFYEIKKAEKVASGWVREKDHPEGVLCKPCPVCGYEYGTKWIKKEVPQEILKKIAAMPPAGKIPAWI